MSRFKLLSAFLGVVIAARKLVASLSTLVPRKDDCFDRRREGERRRCGLRVPEQSQR